MLSGSQMAGALPALLSCGLAVLFRMLPCGVVLVLRGFQIMTECDPGMMRGLLMIAGFVMLGGLAMIFGSVFIVLRCLFVMLVNLEFCHSVLPETSWQRQRSDPARNPAYAADRL
jgi:hypothetical protein